MLTLHFIPYQDIEKLESSDRIMKIIELVKQDKIVLIEGRVTPQEEASLIQTVMSQISSKFKGVELAVIDNTHQNESTLVKIRKTLANLLLGNRSGFTVVGPASVVQEIRQDPSKIELYTIDKKKK